MKFSKRKNVFVKNMFDRFPVFFFYGTVTPDINTITHGPWADQPTDFIMHKTQNSLKLKKFEKM